MCVKYLGPSQLPLASPDGAGQYICSETGCPPHRIPEGLSGVRFSLPLDSSLASLPLFQVVLGRLSLGSTVPGEIAKFT